MSEFSMPLRTSEETACRALSLGALVFRATLEEAEKAFPDRFEHERGIVKLTWWLVSEEILSHQTEWERTIFRQMLGKTPPVMIESAVWRVERLAALLWALGRIDAVPGYDDVVRVESILDEIPLFGPVDEFIETAKLRPADELSLACDIAELWAWRAEVEVMHRNGETHKDGEPIPDLITRAADLVEAEGIMTPIEDDFPVRGKPFSDICDDHLATIKRLAGERHAALAWLFLNEG